MKHFKTVIIFTLCFLAVTSHGSRQPRSVADFQPGEEEQLRLLYRYRDQIRNFVINHMVWPLDILPRDRSQCLACRIAVQGILKDAYDGKSKEEIVEKVKNICVMLDLVRPEICDGVINIFVDPLMYIILNRPEPKLEAKDICGIYLSPDCPGLVKEEYIDWTINLNPNKPNVIPRPVIPDETPKVKFLQIADTHPDLHYVEGSLAECGDPLCCRPSDRDEPENKSISAGYWGHYNCDMPKSAVLDLFDHTKQQHPDTEFILMTGDLLHHEVWGTSIEDQIVHINFFNKELKKRYPDIPIYPAVGNHEAHPCNMFPPHEVWSDQAHDLSWMYEAIVEDYRDDLPQEAVESFLKFGYYSVVHKPGFRLVVVNTNFCYHNNFWLFFNTIDPENHLQWLADTLQEAEDNNEIVWIVGHVPPGFGDCWDVWGKIFDQIVNRYENIIKAQFYGHTHNDDFKIFFDKSEDEPRPSNSMFVAASGTTFTDLNPGYKVFYADGKGEDPTWEITDHETWIYNIEEANQAGGDVNPQWFKEFSFKDAFKVESVRPQDLYQLVLTMKNDDEMFQKFYTYFHKSSEVRSPCDEDCKLRFLCSMVTTDYSNIHCDRIVNPNPTTTTTTTTSSTEKSTTPSTTEKSTTQSSSSKFTVPTFMLGFVLLLQLYKN